MAVTVAQVKAVYTADTSDFTKKTKDAEKGLKDFADRGKKESQSLKNQMAQDMAFMANSVKSAMAVMVTSFVRDGIQRMVKSASELGDSMAKVDTIFGKSSESVKKWSQNTASALGLSQKAALDTAGTIGQLYQNMGIAEKSSAQMSTKLIALAVDLAALNNIGTEEAMERIKRGVRGSAEALDELGLSFNANMVKQKAYKLGLAEQGEALTEATKAQAIYALMMEQGAKVTGQFQRESETLAAQTKMLEAEIENLAADIGKDLVPMARDLVKAFRDDLLPQLRKFGEWFVQIAKDIPVVVTELGKMVDPMGLVATVTQRAANSFAALGEAFSLWMKSVAQDANALGKVQQFLQDASDLEAAAKRAGSHSAGSPITDLTPAEIEAGNRYGLGYSPLVGGGSMNPNQVYADLLRVAKKARQEADNALASAKVVSQMEAAQGKGMDQYYGRGQTSSGLPDLGTPGTTPQAPGAKSAKDALAAARRAQAEMERIADLNMAQYKQYIALKYDELDVARFIAHMEANEFIKAGGDRLLAEKTLQEQLRAIREKEVERIKKDTEEVLMPFRKGIAALTGGGPAGDVSIELPEQDIIQRNTGLGRPNRRTAIITERELNAQNAAVEAFLTDLTRQARRTSRNFLRSLFGGERERGQIFKSLVEDLKNNLIDGLVNSSINFAPMIERLTTTMRDGMIEAVNATLRVAQSGIGQILGAVYQLLSAMNTKGGFNLGTLIGGAAGFALGGWTGGAFGANVGTKLFAGDIGGAFRDTGAYALSGGLGNIGPIGGGGDLYEKKFAAAASRSAQVVYSGNNIYVNERSDINAIGNETVRRLNMAIASDPV